MAGRTSTQLMKRGYLPVGRRTHTTQYGISDKNCIPFLHLVSTSFDISYWFLTQATVYHKRGFLVKHFFRIATMNLEISDSLGNQFSRQKVNTIEINEANIFSHKINTGDGAVIDPEPDRQWRW